MESILEETDNIIKTVASLLAAVAAFAALKRGHKKQAVWIFVGIVVFSLGLAWLTDDKDPDPIPSTEPGYETEAPQISAPVPDGWYPGGIVTYGRYEQDGNFQNGPEPIQWRILDQEDDRFLLISYQVLHNIPFLWAKTASPVTWDNSYIRGWLNSDFYSDSFSDSEKDRIELTSVECRYGSDTEDRVFLLSLDEVQRYMPSQEDRRAVPTPFVKQFNDYEVDGFAWWMMRTSCEDRTKVMSTMANGDIDYDGGSVISDHAGIRPAMWVNWG